MKSIKYEYGKDTRVESVSMQCEKNGDMWDCWDEKWGRKVRSATRLAGAMELILKGANPAYQHKKGAEK